MNRIQHITRTALAAAMAVLLCLPAWAEGLGVPFFRNISANEYNAHNRNFDVVCDDYGTVFVANFECLLYFNGKTWKKIYTPGISRVTRVARGYDGHIWVGGHNVFGYLEADKHGRLSIHTIISDKDNNRDFTEVDFIRPTKDRVYVHTTDEKTFYVENGNKLVELKNAEDIIRHASDSTKTLLSPTLTNISYEHGQGLFMKGKSGSTYLLSENDGLISNAINFITFDKNDLMWAATDRGLFVMDVAMPYTLLTENQGLKGEVLSVNTIGNTAYIGTMDGLFIQDGNRVRPVPEIDLACWQLVSDTPSSLLAATSDGLYHITANGISRITNSNTFAIGTIYSSSDIIAGEIDGIYRITPTGAKTKIADIEKATKIKCTKGVVTAETIFGELWQIDLATKQSKCIRKNADARGHKLNVSDHMGNTWVTDPDGYNLTLKSSSQYGNMLNSWLFPLRSKSVNALHVASNGVVMTGGDFGLITFYAPMQTYMKHKDIERPYIREITIKGDSVLWGGFDPANMKPRYEVGGIELPSNCRSLQIVFSSKTQFVVAPTLYRYRINGGEWSSWSEETLWRDNSIDPGHLTFEVQAMDAFGRESGISKVDIYIHWPWFLRWWAILLFVAFLAWLSTKVLKWRTKMLEAEKEKLEAVVNERTAELSEAYEEQRKTSAELSETLIDLRKTQKDLVRMERTATAGKLTQGLIDRILNPINYINNFSRLTTGLAKDLKEDINDEKDNMDEDNYEDCEDILEMMTQNLKKIEEHGVNTTRTLRAMEAMLNNTIGTLTYQDMVPVCHQVIRGTNDYYKEDIARYGININCIVPEHPVMANIDVEAIGRILMALLGNSIYAVTKKYKAARYDGEVRLTLAEDNDGIQITVRDNGIGIEESIIEKVFDPFFTTKTTAEASGVGLYLVRELVHDHNGNITVSSEKNEYCEFTITLPVPNP